jgi:hypothetical protein
VPEDSNGSANGKGKKPVVETGVPVTSVEPPTPVEGSANGGLKARVEDAGSEEEDA